MDGLGRVVYNQININNNQVNINTSGLRQGSYYVRTESNDGKVEVKKLLIEK